MTRDYTRAMAAADAVAGRVEIALWDIDTRDWRQLQSAGNAAYAAITQYLHSLRALASETLPPPAVLAEGDVLSRASLRNAWDDFGRMCQVTATATATRRRK
ncbi:MAG: hypothetical protein JWO88_3596 [Frankiales bacterium]|nr:hypothetical protein [Frankiales bacterium]